VLGKLSIDYEQREVNMGGRPVEMAAIGYEPLRILSVNAGRLAAYDALLRRVWARRAAKNGRIPAQSGARGSARAEKALFPSYRKFLQTNCFCFIRACFERDGYLGQDDPAPSSRSSAMASATRSAASLTEWRARWA